MQGVEFLNSEEVVLKEKFNWKWFGITNVFTWVITIIAVSFFTYTIPELKNHSINLVYLAIVLVYELVFSWMMGSLNAIPVKYAKQYQVALLDENALKLLEDKYEIIDRAGKLLTIREIT